MTGYVLSPAARADLAEIWGYTAGRWGNLQAERYVLAIGNACESLADGRRKGRPIDNVRPGYFKIAVGSHFLFYRVADTGEIDIVRILHQRMDVESRL
ncbi:MAG: type II toxin-antitoxin system RelE/ParE family toxin [Stellaceae bacterium]